MNGGPSHKSVTAKSTGEMRYCKKCHTRKPDRAHHCSSCRRCVLKMDHHCPWLATCVGFRNQKAFILFLIYVSLFCWLCFAVSATWVFAEFFGQLQYNDDFFPVNCILLAIIAGIIGLVITGFTSWHIYLASRGQTTIESLEKVRYVVPARKAMQQPPYEDGDGHTRRSYDDAGQQEPTLGSQLRTIHANALPGITRPEEGVETPERASTPSDPRTSPAHHALRRNLNYGAYDHNREVEHERARYEAYQEEVSSAKLPHAFNHGWRRNMTQIFGDRPMLIWLPICNSKGDGWNWQPSQDWVEARQEQDRDREARRREEDAFQRDRMDTMPNYWKEATTTSSSSDDDDVPLSHRTGRRGPPPLPRGSSRTGAVAPASNIAPKAPTSDWNDLPDDFLSAPRPDSRNRSRSPAKRNHRKNG